MARVNILKRIKSDNRWKMVSIPRHQNGSRNWKALPEGRYYIEWYEAGKRKRQAAGVTVAQAKETARRKKHSLEGKALGIRWYANQDEKVKRLPLHVAVNHYLKIVEGLKKPNTVRKYRGVLARFLDYFSQKSTIENITDDELNEFMVHLKKTYRLGNNSVIHNMVIVAQFLKKQGRQGITRSLDLPQKITSLPQEYKDPELKKFFKACNPEEIAMFTTFLLTGFREQEVTYMFWNDIKFNLNTIQVKAKPKLGFYPKRWEEREVPVHKHLISLLKKHPHMNDASFVFPSPRGNPELHMLDKCKKIARRAGLDPTGFHLRKFRSTYATRMLRTGFDPRTVQHWMGHKSLETTMRYLAPAKEVHKKLDQLQIAGLLTKN